LRAMRIRGSGRTVVSARTRSSDRSRRHRGRRGTSGEGIQAGGRDLLDCDVFVVNKSDRLGCLRRRRPVCHARSRLATDWVPPIVDTVASTGGCPRAVGRCPGAPRSSGGGGVVRAAATGAASSWRRRWRPSCGAGRGTRSSVPRCSPCSRANWTLDRSAPSSGRDGREPAPAGRPEVRRVPGEQALTYPPTATARNR
jgi:hypothetical protein